MQLRHGLHLAYSTNVHRGETWWETLDALNRYTLKVKAAVSPDRAYGIGLRLSNLAAQQLSNPRTLSEFQHWLKEQHCYVFTINGFPFGQFHGTRIKEQVYRPDWTTTERLEYTMRLFDLLVALLPAGMEGSISTSPGSFKAFISTPVQERRMRDNIWRCVEHIAGLCERTGLDLHLGLEPEPLGHLENTEESLAFFEALRAEHTNDPRLSRHLGVNYDTCHFAVEFEQPTTALQQFLQAGIRLSKIHLSNALRLSATSDHLERLRAFADEVYLHQVVARCADGKLRRFKDLDEALDSLSASRLADSEEWRVHFHLPLHARPADGLEDTCEHISDTLEFLKAHPTLCRHLEMETYTWEVLPPALRTHHVEDQLIAEYQWTLNELHHRGFKQESGT